MNFLAHLHLARPNPASRMGNLLGDFVKGRPDERFTPAIWRGIMHHRHLDAFTDAHPFWKQSRARLAPERTRFAGIVVDVFYDHFLSQHWSEFASDAESLPNFITACHDDLRGAAELAPPNALPILDRMERQQWLAAYIGLEGIDEAICRMSRRSPRFAPMKGAVADLKADYAGFDRDFLSFYPDAITRSNQLHREAEETDSPL